MRYIIQIIDTPNVCLGVAAREEGASVVLMPLDGTGTDNTNWYLDHNTGLIQLVADQRLFLGVQGGKLSAGAHLVAERFVLGRTTQSWDWTSKPNFVLNRYDTSYCFDANQKRDVGTQALAYPKGDDNTNQKWRIVAAEVLREAGKA